MGAGVTVAVDGRHRIDVIGSWRRPWYRHRRWLSRPPSCPVLSVAIDDVIGDVAMRVSEDALQVRLISAVGTQRGLARQAASGTVGGERVDVRGWPGRACRPRCSPPS